MKKVVVIGAGMGGLSAAIRARQCGFKVQLFEARSSPGGLASGFSCEGMEFDAGPYILLDRPGLEWAFDRLGLPFEGPLSLNRIEDVYRVRFSDPETDAHAVQISDDLDRTAERLDETWPGSGEQYRHFVDWSGTVHERFRPLQWIARPGVLDVIRTGAWRNVFFLLQSLETVLGKTGLPESVQKAISIWTHVAGQPVDEAPSVLSLVPCQIHSTGSFYPQGGIRAIPQQLARKAQEDGVQIHYDCHVDKILSTNHVIQGVQLESGEKVEADAVISNYSGVGTYLELLDDVPSSYRRTLENLPMQSPGVCAYLRVKGRSDPPYLRFSLPSGEVPCQLFIQPDVLRDGNEKKDEWSRARLLSPLPHERAGEMTEQEQQQYLDDLIQESWWRENVQDVEVIARRTAYDWGRDFYLFENSMNPVMTAKFMRRGRMAHRSPYFDGLYLAGSSTHPGQWVSFCAVSGIHAAETLREDQL